VPARPHTGLRGAVATLWAVAAVGVALLLGACGSSKPAYCTDLNNLKQSVQALGNVNPVQNGVSSLTAALDKVKTDAQTLATSAKSELGPQVDAVEKALNDVEASLKQLSSSSTRATALSNLPSQISALQTSLQNLDTAAKKCK
jgi:uncharacterized phage infection (PIP) family protein YhgE